MKNCGKYNYFIKIFVLQTIIFILKLKKREKRIKKEGQIYKRPEKGKKYIRIGQRMSVLLLWLYKVQFTTFYYTEI